VALLPLALLPLAAASGGRHPRPLRTRVLLSLAGLLVPPGLALGLVLAGSPRPPAGGWLALGLGGLAVARLDFARTRLGHALTLGAGLLALLFVSRTGSAYGYGLAALLLLTAGGGALLIADPSFPPPPRWDRRLLLPLAVSLLGAWGLGVGLARGLVRAQPTVQEALLPWLLTASGTATSGLGAGSLQLGNLREILTSDEVALRLHGEEVERLRGLVYTRYALGRWQRPGGREDLRVAGPDGRLPLVLAPPATAPAAPGTPAPVASPPPTAAAPPTSRLRLEAQPALGRTLLAPLATRALAKVPPGSSVDHHGVLQLSPDALVEERDYELELLPDPGPAAPPERALSPPGPSERELPAALRSRLTALAGQHAGDALTPRQQVTALVAALQRESAYSLELPAVPPGRDPVLHFLTRERVGHCELFASALVLLARALGIPARLVTGYLVVERNPLGGYAVVRQRDAHAWAEVWLDGRWETVDPTPAGELLRDRRRTLEGWAGRWERLARVAGRAWDRLARLTWLEIGLGAGSALGLALLWLAVRRRRRGARRPATGQGSRFPPLARLERALERTLGLRRPPSQTLQDFAATLRQGGHEPAARLLERCARLRYGGGGDPDEIAREIDDFLRS
jgi:transglutaminase-like putative cysteine protease